MEDLNINSFDYHDIESLKKVQSNSSKDIFAFYTESNKLDKNNSYCNSPYNNQCNTVLESILYSGIIKTNISDLFPVFTILKNSCNNTFLNKMDEKNLKI